MNVDLPTPGTPLMPMRSAPPVCGSSSASSCCACSRWSARRDSTSVIARATAARRPGPHPVGQLAASRSRPTSSGDFRVSGDQSPSTRSRSCAASRSVSFSSISIAASRDDGAGREDRGRAGRAQRVEVLRRDHPPTTIMMSSRPCSASSSRSSRHQRQVPGGERVDADDVDVGLDRLPRHLGRRLEQRAHVDVEAEVGERGRRAPSARGRDRPGPSWPSGCAGGGPAPPRTRRSRRGPASMTSTPAPAPPRGRRPEIVRIVAECRP